jgi:hypothetical protein
LNKDLSSAERKWGVVNIATTEDGKKWKDTFRRRVQEYKEIESSSVLIQHPIKTMK